MQSFLLRPVFIGVGRENTSSPISLTQFQSSLVSCGIPLSGSEFDELFRCLVEYHDPAKSKDTSIELRKVKEFLRLADLYIGKDGKFMLIQYINSFNYIMYLLVRN
jgi:hypothetical protein